MSVPTFIPMICVSLNRDFATGEETALAPYVKYVAVIDFGTYTADVLLALLKTLNPAPAGVVVDNNVPNNIEQNVLQTALTFQNDPTIQHPNLGVFVVAVPENLSPNTQAQQVGFIKATIDQYLGINLPGSIPLKG